MGILRLFHTGLRYQKANSSAMSILRKKTGYTFSNIRKALELNENDIDKVILGHFAEKWLVDQAKEMGWDKAIKLQERVTTQGLVGVAVKNKKIAMVEVNCETDFVSRTEKFRSLVELIAKTCLQQPVLTTGQDTHQVEFNTDDMRKLQADNTSLADHVALLISSVGENTVIKKGYCYETSRNDIEIAYAVHPPSNSNSGILLGKYSSFISYQVNSETSSDIDIAQVASDICTHIIGMNPLKVGEYGKDEPSENGDDENVLIHQDFLLNDSITVGQLLTDSGITLLDFQRFPSGNSTDKENSLENNLEQQSADKA